MIDITQDMKDRMLLYTCLTRYGPNYKLRFNSNVRNLLDGLEPFSNLWKPYNPRHKVERFGLSITSLDGELSGVPDLDSLYQYNADNNTSYNELSFTKKTQIYDLVSDWFSELKEDLCRTHIIKLGAGGFFPMHRDTNEIDIKSFRIIVPLKNCNTPGMFFILNKNILNFDHGYAYFIDTCLEHTVFNASYMQDAYFIVANIALNARSVDKVLNNKSVR